MGAFHSFYKRYNDLLTQEQYNNKFCTTTMCVFVKYKRTLFYTITTKSSKVLGMVKRTLGPCKPEVKDTAYNMLVRPKLEYASPIWNPHTSSQIIHLKRIQHYAARFLANDHRRTNRRTTSPTTLVLTPTGLLTRSHNRHHYIVPRS